MKVSELISELQKHSSSAEVFMDSETAIADIGEVVEYRYYKDDVMYNYDTGKRNNTIKGVLLELGE